MALICHLVELDDESNIFEDIQGPMFPKQQAATE